MVSSQIRKVREKRGNGLMERDKTDDALFQGVHALQQVSDLEDVTFQARRSRDSPSLRPVM